MHEGRSSFPFDGAPAETSVRESPAPLRRAWSHQTPLMRTIRVVPFAELEWRDLNRTYHSPITSQRHFRSHTSTNTA
jgi:hypothetical protein